MNSSPNGQHRLFLSSSGLQVSAAFYGVKREGLPVFYLHGFPGSRLEASLADEVAQSLGLSIIAIDRPGFGLTPHSPARTFMDFPFLIKEVADQLKLDRFGILAVSGGAPYALATAAALGERVFGVSIISGMGPVDNSELLKGMVFPNKLLLMQAQKLPRIGYLSALAMASWWRSYPSHMVRWLALLLKGDDKRLLAQAGTRELLERNVREALRQGVVGAAQELLLLSRRWQVPFGRIAAPTTFWHGDADTYVPISFARYLHALVPGSELQSLPNKGHFMCLDILPDVLEELKARWLS